MQRVELDVRKETEGYKNNLPAADMIAYVDHEMEAFKEPLKTVTLDVRVLDGKVRLRFTPLEGGESANHFIDSTLPDLRVYFGKGMWDRVTVAYRSSPADAYLKKYKITTIIPKVTGEE